MSARTPYPVRLTGTLDPATSRWLWLLKWLLVLPHLVVLVFLWIAVVFTTIAAGVAILFTRRYPEGLFDFNVGVLRWSWRVEFYSVGAFGTDRYPPFSLRPDPSYPADLVVDRPGELSRGLVLVKWWLLALPQLLIIGILGGGYGAGWGHVPAGGGGGLIALLSVIAGVILLFTGTYPTQLFDLVLGFDRWVYRVLGYVLLMTDEYPPFRLDAGGADPGPVPVGPSTLPRTPVTA